MMRTRKGPLLLAMMLALLAITVPAASDPGDQIIVSNADEVVESSVSVDPRLVSKLEDVDPRIVLQYGNELLPTPLATIPGSLETLLGQVSARVVLQYANAIRHDGLVAIPGTLQGLLEQVSPRVVLQYANAIRHDNMVPIPGRLQTLLGQVLDRMILQYANTNRREDLVYPVGLLNDTTSPEISGISTSGSGIVTWATDEYADSAVLYGTVPGVYPRMESSALYTRQHKVALMGLTPGTIYYYQVRSADRSGNATTSAEHNFTASILVYLPVVLRGG
jgi:hypothetical protein